MNFDERSNQKANFVQNVQNDDHKNSKINVFKQLNKFKYI